MQTSSACGSIGHLAGGAPALRDLRSEELEVGRTFVFPPLLLVWSLLDVIRSAVPPDGVQLCNGSCSLVRLCAKYHW